MYNSDCWLCHGHVLDGFVESLNEIKLFEEEK
jgi:hypothetical protein